MAKRAVLLINLGSPDEPTVPAVRRYLREFLSDPRVIDIPALSRFFLVNFIIAPFRSRTSARAYQKVWTKDGSPLVAISQELTGKVQKLLGSDYIVRLGMRYGRPSLTGALQELCKNTLEELIVIPLFPQYATSSTGSAIELLLKSLSQQTVVPHLRIIQDFYADPGFIKAFAQVARPQLKTFQPDHVLFSYHGLPVHHLTQLDRSPDKKHCHGSVSCCDAMVDANRNCYRAQCFAGTRALVEALQLAPGTYTTAFQSRLGRAEWIKPYTDKKLPELRQEGVKRLAVMCPAFVADCLETLEEIEIRAAEDWRALGGEDLKLVHSLNAEAEWVETLANWVRSPEKVRSKSEAMIRSVP